MGINAGTFFNPSSLVLAKDAIEPLSDLKFGGAYSPSISPTQNDNYVNSVNRISNQAQQPYQTIQDRMNQGIREKSNLLGDSSRDDPETLALSARARQMHSSDVNHLMRTSVASAVNQQGEIQTRDVANRAAQFSNAQSRATLTYQQVSYQREAAINEELAKRTLYAQIFGGPFLAGGAAAASGIYNSKHKTPMEDQQGYRASQYSVDQLMHDTQSYNQPTNLDRLMRDNSQYANPNSWESNNGR